LRQQVGVQVEFGLWQGKQTVGKLPSRLNGCKGTIQGIKAAQVEKAVPLLTEKFLRPLTKDGL